MVARLFQQTVGAPSRLSTLGCIVFFMALGGVIPMLTDRLDLSIEG